MDLPQEIYDMIVLHVVDYQHDDSRGVARSTAIHHKEGREQLSILRLVNKGFCRSASISLFRTIHATSPACPRDQRPNHWSPRRLLELSKSRYCLDVRKIVVDIKPRSGYETNLLSSTYRQFVQDLITLLPRCLYRFCRLSSLHIFGHTMTVPWSRDCDYLQDLRVQLTTTIATVFQSVPFLDLEELVLRLPDPKNFAALLRETESTASCFSIRSAMRGIKHLDLAVCDVPDAWHHTIDTSSLIVVASQRDDTAKKVFEIVGFAPNLEVLKISSLTDLLDMDVDLNKLNNLRTLHLRKTIISTSHFRSLISRNRASIRDVNLQSIELNSGTWADIFLALCSLPHLENFHVSYCRYWRDGQSSVWVPLLFQCRRDPPAIVSNHHPDEFALGNLVRHVIANRRARELPELTGPCLKHTNLQPLEDVFPDFTVRRIQED